MPLFKSKKKKEEEAAALKADEEKKEADKKTADENDDDDESETETGSEEESEEESETGSEEETESKSEPVKKDDKPEKDVKTEKESKPDGAKDENESEEETDEESDDEESEQNKSEKEDKDEEEEEDTTEKQDTSMVESSAPLDSAATDLPTDLSITAEGEDEEEEEEEIFEAVEDYTGEEDGDLSFIVGDKLTIIDKQDDGWWEAEKENGDRGMVPSTYLKQVPHEPSSPGTPKTGKALWTNLRSAIKETTTTDVLQIMGAVPSGFRKGYLRNLEKASDAIKAYLMPKLSPSHLFFKDMVYSNVQGRIKSRPSQWCRMIEVTIFRNIPLPGKGIKVIKRLVRVCLFDGTRVLSNIVKLEAMCTDKEQTTWTFNHKENDQMQSSKLGDLFVRTNSAAANIGILFELSVIFMRVSNNEESELTCGWGILPLYEEDGMPTPNRAHEVAIHGGTPEEKGTPLDSNTAQSEQGSKFRSLLMRNRSPHLSVKLYPSSKEQKELLDMLPDTLIGSAAHISLYAYYRQILADQLLRDRMDIMSTELISDPFLATFPLAANDSFYMDILRNAWVETMKKLTRQQKKDMNILKSVYVKCFMIKVYPRLFMSSHHQELDRKELGSNPVKSPRYLDPVVMLMSADVEHKPFCTSEVAFNLVNSYCVART